MFWLGASRKTMRLVATTGGIYIALMLVMVEDEQTPKNFRPEPHVKKKLPTLYTYFILLLKKLKIYPFSSSIS